MEWLYQENNVHLALTQDIYNINNLFYDISLNKDTQAQEFGELDHVIVRIGFVTVHQDIGITKFSNQVTIHHFM